MRDQIKNWISGLGQKSLERAEIRSIPAKPPTDVLTPGFRTVSQKIYTPPDRTARTGLMSYESNPFVHVVVGRVADKFASQPYYLKRRNRDDGEKIIKHPALDFLMSGSEILDGFQSRRLVAQHLDLSGETFLLLGYDSSGLPASYLPLPANWVTQPAYREGEFFEIMIPRTAVSVKVPWRSMIWLKRPRPSDPTGRGYSATQALATEIGLQDEIAAFFFNFVKNRARPDIIITGSQEDPLSVEDARALESRWMQQHGGTKNAGKPMISNAPLEVHEVGQTMQETEISDMRKISRDFVLQVYGVQPSVFGIIENANRATAEAADFTMARDVIEPRLEAFVQAMYPRLLIEFPDLVRYHLHFESPVAEDKEFKLNVLRAAPSAFKKDDARTLAGYEPDPERGDEYLKEDDVDLGETENGDPNALADGNTDSPNKALPRAARRLLPVTRALTEAQVNDLVAGVDERHDDLVLLLSYSLRSSAIQAALDLAPGRGVSIEALTVELSAWAEMRASILLDLLNETSRETLRATLETAGDDRALIGGAILTLFASWSQERAAFIAGTEANGAVSTAETAIGRAAGATSKVWLTQSDERVRALHRPMHGQVRGINEAFVSPNGETGQGPGLFASAAMNVNCVLAGTAVQSIGGIKRVYSRKYQGPVVTIKTANGSDLSGTPNHPVLTDRGWVALGELKNGDNVVRCGVVGGVAAPKVQNPNDAPLIEQVLRLSEVSGLRERILGSTPQFHGDGLEGEVNIVTLDGHLRGEVEASLSKDGCKLSLSRADVVAASLSSDGHLGSLVDGVLSASGDAVGGHHEGLPVLDSGAGHAVEHGLGPVSRLNSGSNQNPLDDISVDPKVASEGLDATAIVVSLDQVVSVQVNPNAHVDVYNLETETGAYISNGMIVSNCRCGTRSFSGSPPTPEAMATLLAQHERTLRLAEAVTAAGIRSVFASQQGAILNRLGNIR